MPSDFKIIKREVDCCEYQGECWTRRFFFGDIYWSNFLQDKLYSYDHVLGSWLNHFEYPTANVIDTPEIETLYQKAIA